jgi:membrane associated rhomboid family serine protease
MTRRPDWLDTSAAGRADEGTRRRIAGGQPTFEDSVETTVRVSRNARRVGEWAVVMDASGIPHRVGATAAGWAVVVAGRDAARARSVLAAYDRENQDEAVVDEAAPNQGPLWVGVVVAGLLVGFFAVTGPPVDGTGWFERGAASAEHILQGEVWRTVTALTLHVDLVHVLSNAVAGALLIAAVAQRFGPGIGLWLMLLAGAAGNGLTAAAQGGPHISVGASTSTFGAVGILAGLQLVGRGRGPSSRSKPWVVVTTSVVLLGLLGSGLGSDVLAHLYGLLVGIGLGFGLAGCRPARPAIQWALVVSAVVAVVGCWRLA